MNADLLDLEVMIKNIVVERYLVKVLLCMLFPYGKCLCNGGGGGGGGGRGDLACMAYTVFSSEEKHLLGPMKLPDS